jgi:hypothetical protein
MGERQGQGARWRAMTNWNVLVNLLCRSHARARGVFFVAIAAGPTGGSAAPSSFTRGGRAGAGGRSGRRRRRFRFQLCAVGSGMELSRSGRAGMRAPPGARYELDYRAHLLACPGADSGLAERSAAGPLDHRRRNQPAFAGLDAGWPTPKGPVPDRQNDGRRPTRNRCRQTATSAATASETGQRAGDPATSGGRSSAAAVGPTPPSPESVPWASR